MSREESFGRWVLKGCAPIEVRIGGALSQRWVPRAVRPFRLMESAGSRGCLPDPRGDFAGNPWTMLAQTFLPMEGVLMGSADESKRLAREFFERIWNQKDEAAIDEFIPADAKGNDADFGSGREGFRKQWRAWHAAFPDLHFEIVDLIAEGDKVLTRWTLTGTHEGEILGAPGTGKKIKVEGMSFDLIENGLVAEGFDGWDNLGFRRQLGLKVD